MQFLNGFIMWILLSATIFVNCFAKPMPVKRRMVLRLPFVNNGESNTFVRAPSTSGNFQPITPPQFQKSQSSFQNQRTFLRMLNGNSKMKKDVYTSHANIPDFPLYMYMLRQ